MGIELKNVFRSRNSRSMRESLSSGEINEREVGDRGDQHSSKEPVMVEPKTYFANERTFIQWISAALLLLTVSSILMGSGNYNGTSSVIAFAAMLLVTYASYVYFRRVRLLRSGEAYGYLDFLGPSILAAGVGVGVFIVFADAIKGSEFIPWNSGDAKEDRRYLVQSSSSFSAMPETMNMIPPSSSSILLEDEQQELLHQVDGKCTRYDAMAMDGFSLLEYQPRDIVMKKTATTSELFELLVATPQSLVSHPLLLSSGASATSTVDCSGSTVLRSDIADTELQSITMVGGDRLFALSTGPYRTELIEFPNDNDDKEELSRVVIQDSPSHTGSMVFVPSSTKQDQDINPQDGKFYILLDGSMHTYHLLKDNKNSSTPTTTTTTTTPWRLVRVGSINMKVLNRGNVDNNDITAMTHFEGLTYLLRPQSNTMEAWDLTTATLVSILSLPVVTKNDQWMGMAFHRRRRQEEEGQELYLRRKDNTKTTTTTTTVVDLHMPLDTFPPQLWTFRLEYDDKNKEYNTFRFPDECIGMAMN